MLISYKHSLLYIHVQKTAGTSLTHYLNSEIADLQEILRPHDPLYKAQQALGANFDNLLKVGFVRNPFDRLVSWYSMIVEHGSVLSDHEKIKDPNYNRIWQHVLDGSSCFEEFVLNCSDAVDRSGWKPFLYNQVDYFKNTNGDIAADFIGRFENLEQDFAQLCTLINIEQKSVPHVNRSKHVNYQKYYSEQARAVVEKRFAEDLNYFDYQF